VRLEARGLAAPDHEVTGVSLDAIVLPWDDSLTPQGKG
jgi:hypothetical protein